METRPRRLGRAACAPMTGHDARHGPAIMDGQDATAIRIIAIDLTHCKCAESGPCGRRRKCRVYNLNKATEIALSGTLLCAYRASAKAQWQCAAARCTQIESTCVIAYPAPHISTLQYLCVGLYSTWCGRSGRTGRTTRHGTGSPDRVPCGSPGDMRQLYS